MLRNNGKPLVKRRSAPPPTATTTMLESMLDGAKAKKKAMKKRKRPPAKELLEDVSNTAEGRIFPTGGLEDAPTFVPMKKKKFPPEQQKDKKNAKSKAAGPSLDHGARAKATMDTGEHNRMSLTLNIGKRKKRPHNPSVVASSSVPVSGLLVERPSSLASSSLPTSAESLELSPPVSHTPAPNDLNDRKNHSPIDLSDQIVASRHAETMPRPFSATYSISFDQPANETRLTSWASASTRENESQTHHDWMKPKASEHQQSQSGFDRKPKTLVARNEAPAVGQSKRKVNNDNFVRLNLRNSAGACRGARNKKNKRRFSNRNETEDAGEAGHNVQKPMKSRPPRKKTLQSGVDPLDDFLDGVFQPKPASKESPTDESTRKAPLCARHQRPCKLLVVKKNTTGNKGRQFYACSMPRGEQCDHFEWADNTVEAAQRALLRNASYSGFVARQVAAYAERFKSLTVPELRDEAKRRNLLHTGKRQQLLMRLSVWVRDELTQVADAEDMCLAPTMGSDSQQVHAVAENEESESDGSSVSSEELELCHATIPSGKDEQLNSDESSDDENEVDDDNEEPFGSLVDASERAGLPASSNSLAPPTSLLENLQQMFGYAEFREGQEWAVRRCLAKRRTVLVAPTGFGKSLCYALPAALMDGICVVVSPLISLMQDQLRQLPPRIPAATLSGTMTAAEMASTVDDVIRNRLKILFVSPERLASSSFRRLFQLRWNPNTNTRERSFPTISLLCVDEAHCMSQWGHSFRPSYLRLRSLLELMQPESVLAMTATAGPLVVKDICDALQIRSCCSLESPQDAESAAEKDTGSAEKDTGSSVLDPVGVKILTYDRDNIDVCCKIMSNEDERLSLLMKLLREKKTEKKSGESDTCLEEGLLGHGSVIVYVWRQRDAEVVAENLIASGINGGVAVYHGGMDNVARAKAQSKFMRGKVRICVATVAFGMGINKADVAAVVHLYLPGSPENYLQEIGRAGRDGRRAMAVALVLSDEVVVRHSLAHSNMLSTSQIRALLQILRKLVLAALDAVRGEKETGVAVSTIESCINVALPVESTVMATDCKIETIETLVSLLEEVNTDQPLLRIQGITRDQATITLKRRSLEKLSALESVARCIEKCGTCLDSPDATQNQEAEFGDLTHEQRQKDKAFLAYSFGSYTFSITQCASLLGEFAEPRHVFAALRRLQTAGELELMLTGEALHVKIEPSGIRRLTGSDSSLDEVAETLSSRFSAHVTAVAKKALDARNILHQVAAVDQSRSVKGSVSASLRMFRGLVEKYFDGNEVKGSVNPQDELPRGVQASIRKEITLDASSLLRDMKGFPNFQPSKNSMVLDLRRLEVRDYTALTITKFLHGIDTPRAPYSAFSRHPLFGKWRDVKFTSLLTTLEGMLETSAAE